jgi:hypothetical protein
MQINTTEQNAYGLIFVPVRDKVNAVTSGWGYGHYAQLMAGFKHYTSTTQGGYIHFRFRGRRIGVLLAKMKGYGKLSFILMGRIMVNMTPLLPTGIKAQPLLFIMFRI